MYWQVQSGMINKFVYVPLCVCVWSQRGRVSSTQLHKRGLLCHNKIMTGEGSVEKTSAFISPQIPTPPPPTPSMLTCLYLCANTHTRTHTHTGIPRLTVTMHKLNTQLRRLMLLVLQEIWLIRLHRCIINTQQLISVMGSLFYTQAVLLK